MKVFFVIVLAILVIIFAPFLGIWCINTMWDVNNPYDFWHWLAAFVMSGALGWAINWATGRSK